MTEDECRAYDCQQPTQDARGYAGNFCSPQCEVTHDHNRADAKDAIREAEPERVEEQP